MFEVEYSWILYSVSKLNISIFDVSYKIVFLEVTQIALFKIQSLFGIRIIFKPLKGVLSLYYCISE